MRDIFGTVPYHVGEGARVAFVFGAPGENEEKRKLPITGRNAYDLSKMWKGDAEVHMANFIPQPSPTGDANWFFVNKTDPDAENEASPPHGSKRVRAAYWSFVVRLREWLQELKPNVVVAFGAEACWACTGEAKLAGIRGTVVLSDWLPGIKVIPTYSFETARQMYSQRFYLEADLRKAARHAESPKYVQPVREVWIEPTLADVRAFFYSYMRKTETFAYDIETVPDAGVITCIGLAPNDKVALVVPFYDSAKPGGNYWSRGEELKVVAMLQKLFNDPSKRKLAQNGMYDLMWLAKLGIKPEAGLEDTMLLHHSYQPELKKGLGELAALYLDEVAWKTSVSFKKSNKKDA